MSQIDSIRLTNFKAFKDSKLLSLSKINLIVGKNSAGKSSVIKSILGCSQTAREKKVDSSDFRLVGAHTDLGTFKDTVHGNDEAKSFSISFGIKGPEKRDSEQHNFQFTYKYSKGPGLITAKVAGVEVRFDGNLLCSAGKAYKNQHDFDTSDVVLSNLKTSDSSKVVATSESDQNVDENMPDLMKKLLAVIEEEHSKAKKGDQEAKQFMMLDDLCLDFSVFIKKQKGERSIFRWTSSRILNRDFFDRPQFAEAHFASGNLDKMLANCVYIGPLREEPTRSARLAISSGRTTGKKGEDLAVMLHLSLKDNKFKNKFNKYLKNLNIADGIITSASYLDIGNSSKLTGYINILLEKNGQYNSLVDVGFGTSQVLPIIFELMAQKDRLILIEQPELHLHPSAQAELGELLNDSIKSGNQLIIETHSATLIERLRRLIRNGELSNKDVRIIYVQDDSKSNSSICKQIGFLSDGDFDAAWPEKDFFGEREAEALSDWW